MSAVDMSALVAAWLAADTDVAAVVGEQVYADMLPPDVTYPCVLVRELALTPAVPPTLAWDTHELQVDLIGRANGQVEAVELRAAVRSALIHLHGDIEGTVVAATDVLATTGGVDASVSPARPRWVVAVEVTART
jgi:hypothetical protein